MGDENVKEAVETLNKLTGKESQMILHVILAKHTTSIQKSKA